MTKKVTGKELKDLLEGALRERVRAWPDADPRDLDPSTKFSDMSKTFPGMGKSWGNGKTDLTDFMSFDGSPPNTLDKDDFDIFFKPVDEFNIDAYNALSEEQIDAMGDAHTTDVKDMLRTLLDWSHKAKSDIVKDYGKQKIDGFIAKYPADSFNSDTNAQKLLRDLKAEASDANIALPLAKPIANNNDTSTSTLEDTVISHQGTPTTWEIPRFLTLAVDKTPYPNATQKNEFIHELISNASPEYLATPTGKKYGTSALTGLLVQDVITNPSHYRQYHTSLVQMMRKSLDEASKQNPPFTTSNSYWKSVSDLLKKMPRATDSSDSSIGKDSPIPQFPITSNMAEEGYAMKTSQLVIDVFESSFGGTTVDEKINKMKVFSEAFNAGNISGSYQEQLSNTIVLDFFRRVVQDYDASSAGFLFESFLALLFSGTKLGGNQRLEDFEIGGKLTGTSPQPVTLKLFQEGSTKTTSAFSTFEKFFAQNPGGKITSITGVKGAGNMSVEFHKKEITSDTWDKVSSSRDPTAGEGKYTNGVAKFKPKDGAMKIAVKIDSGDSIGTVEFGFLSVNEDQFLKQAADSFTGAAKEIGEMFKFYNNFKINATKYLTDKASDPNSAASAIDTFNEMREKATIIFNPEASGAIADTTDPIKSSNVTQRIAEEQKITADFLKKLISESFKR